MHTQLMVNSATAFGENFYSNAAINQALAFFFNFGWQNKKRRATDASGQRYTFLVFSSFLILRRSNIPLRSSAFC